jgi:hypothetical protein
LQSYNAECRNRCSVSWSADYKRRKYNSGARPGLTENSLLKSNMRWHCGFLDCHCGRGDSGLASGLQPWLACIQIECHQDRELRCSVARRASARQERGVHGADVSTRAGRMPGYLLGSSGAKPQAADQKWVSRLHRSSQRGAW